MNNPQYLKRLIIQIDQNLLREIRFDNGGTVLHRLAMYPNLIKQIMTTERAQLFEKILLETDDKHQTFMHLLVNNEYIDDIRHVLTVYDGDEVMTALFATQDKSNDNCMMIICRSTQTEFQELFTLIVPYIMTAIEILEKKDHEGQSLLSLAAKFVDTELWKQLIEKATLESLYETIEVLTVSNTENLAILMQRADVVAGYSNFTRCFALACRYSPAAIKMLLATEKVDLCNCYDVIKIRDENGVENYIANYVQIACRYNADSLKELMNCNIDMTAALDEINIDNKDRHFNAFVLAMMYEPEAVRILINSKYMTTDYIVRTSQIVKTSCYQFASESQIASYTYMALKGNNDFKKDPNANNTAPQMFSQGIRASFYNIQVQDVPLYKHKDTMCATTDPRACTVCCSNHMKVVFSPCGHKACVSCSVKLGICPQCRSQISHRLVFD